MRSSNKNNKNKQNSELFTSSYEECRELPLAYNVSSTHYCGFKMKKKFIQRYLLAHQEKMEASSSWRNGRMVSTREEKEQRAFKISPIKILENSPSLIRSRLKTEHPKIRIYRHPNAKKQASVYKTCEIGFITTKAFTKDKRIRLVKTSNTKLFKQQPQVRPFTANSPLITQHNSTLRRTQTLENATSVPASKRREQAHHPLKGWDNQCPEYE